MGGVKGEFCGGGSLLGDNGAACRTRDTRFLHLTSQFLLLRRLVQIRVWCESAVSRREPKEGKGEGKRLKGEG